MASFVLLKSVTFFANAYQKTMKTKVKKMHKIKQKLFKCRICNKEKGNVPIFKNNIQPNIPEEIEKISGISLSESDNLSKHMCQGCLDLLNGCILFRDMCQENNLILAEVSIKKEFRTNYEKYEESPEVKAASSSILQKQNIVGIQRKQSSQSSEKQHIAEAEYCRNPPDSYNIPSPTFSESNSDLWSCMFCGKEFINMATYDNHISKCSAVTTEVPKPPEVKKRFLCDTCGITTCSHPTLLAHMLTHTNVFPFKCDVCPYQGRTMTLLTVHKRSHMAEKPYKCTLCPKSTTTSSNLAKHMKHMHSTIRPHKCTYCDKAFKYQHVMKRHIRDIHLSQGMVQCDVCNKKFKSKNVLQDHKFKLHKIKGKRLGRLPSYLQCQMESGGEK